MTSAAIEANPALPADCRCAGCAALRAEYGADAELFAFYRKKLLTRGWAGKASAAEKAYQRAHATWAQVAAERGFPGRGPLKENAEISGYKAAITTP